LKANTLGTLLFKGLRALLEVHQISKDASSKMIKWRLL